MHTLPEGMPARSPCRTTAADLHLNGEHFAQVPLEPHLKLILAACFHNAPLYGNTIGVVVQYLVTHFPCSFLVPSCVLISPAMSSFFIFRNASTTLFDRAGSAINSSSTRGTTCQLTPNLSLSQPQWPLLPPSEGELPAVHGAFAVECLAWGLHIRDASGCMGPHTTPGRIRL